MEYLIDYLTFTVKYDKRVSPEHTAYVLDMDFMYHLLGLSDVKDCFIDMGAKQHYAHKYVYNKVGIYESSAGRSDMGLHVELSGQGCRFIESHYAEINNGEEFDWVQFFKKLYLLMEGGLAVNVCRLDLAVDDYDGILDVDEMKQCLINGEIVSLYRGGDRKGLLQCYECESFKRMKGETVVGKTLYIGNRKSTSFCRVYDKKAEQLMKNSNNEEIVKNMKKLKHWVRFEMVFRNTSAIKIISAMIRQTHKEFSKFFAETINTYIRFVNLDDSNKTRCSLKAFWLKFIGTVERARLSTEGLAVNALSRAKQWLKHSLAPTLFAMIEKLGKDEFYNLIEEEDPKERYKSKHLAILNATEEDNYYTCKEFWDSLIPECVKNREVAIG